MELSSQMILFAHVVEGGSFSAAARAMNHSPSAVSKQIGALEDRLGLRLLNRTQQGIGLTEEGRVFYNRCAEVAATVSETQELLEFDGREPARGAAGHGDGGLRQGADPADPARLPGDGAGPEGEPGADRPRHRPVLGGCRRDDPLLGADREHLGHRAEAGAEPAVLVASPSYIQRFGMPETPEDLMKHNCLRLSTVEKWNQWRFGKGRMRATCRWAATSRPTAPTRSITRRWPGWAWRGCRHTLWGATSPRGGCCGCCRTTRTPRRPSTRCSPSGGT